MLQCPYCLERVEPKTETQGNTTFYVCQQEQCQQRLARDYVESSLPRTAIGIIGFSGHGKTVFLHSLFYVLSLMENEWPGYHSKSLDDETDEIIHTMVRRLQVEALLPDSSPANFPRPALLLHKNIPEYGNWFISMYDTAGAVFEDVQSITEQGRYVAHAETVFFLVSLADLGDNPGDRLKFLLGKYLRAVQDHMRVDLKKQQNLVVVFTKADILRNGENALTEELDTYLRTGTYLDYSNLAKEGKARLQETSHQIETWLKKRCCQGFLSMARENFRDVALTVVSATGAATEGQSLGATISPEGPKRMLDPLLWALEYAQIRDKRERRWRFLSPFLKLSKAQRRRAVVIGVVIVFLLGGGYRLFLELSKRYELSRQKDAKVAVLMQEAEKDLKENRLISPKGQNAVEKYNAALAIRPDQAEVKNGLQQVALRYVSFAKEAMTKGEFDKAADHLDKAESIAKGMEEVKSLREELTKIKAEENRKKSETVAQRQKVEQLMAVGGAAEKSGNLQEALARYQEADDLKTNLPGIKEKIAQVEKNIAAAEVVKLADANLQAGRLQEALAGYQEAQALLPLQLRKNSKQGGVNEKIAVVTEKIREAKAKVEAEAKAKAIETEVLALQQRAEKLMTMGSAAEKSGNLQEALAHYQEADGLKANLPQIKDMIAKVQGQIRGEETKSAANAPVSPHKLEKKPDAIIRLAEQGDANAQYNLGMMYDQGQGVTRDFVNAMQWYHKAAEQGNAEAQNKLGEMYATGRGVSQNDIKALEWLHKAAEQRNAEAEYNIGTMYDKGRGGLNLDKAMAIEWYHKATQGFREAAEKGNADAQAALGGMYAEGLGIAKDYTKAVEWFRKSAEQGNAYGQASLGAMYSEEKGVSRDDTKALEWLRKSAEQGNAYAQESLGVMYSKGQGVTKDDSIAVEWFRKSAEQGNAYGQASLGARYSEGQGVDKDYTKAVEWLRKSADQGNPLGQLGLGAQYAKGQGVAKDNAKAKELLHKAAEQDNATAKDILKKIQP